MTKGSCVEAYYNLNNNEMTSHVDFDTLSISGQIYW